MTQSYTYENGESFTESLRKNIDTLIERVHVKGMASVIVVCGTPGTGKTTLAAEISGYIAKKLGRPPFSVEHQIDIGGEKFLEKARYCVENNLPALVFDEAFAFSRRKSLTKFNQDLNEFFQEFRTFKLIVILCLPDYNQLDRWLYNIRVVRLLIECSEKHIANNRSIGYVSFKAYGIKRIYDVLNIRDKLKLPYASSRVPPNFQGHFKPLPPAQQAALDASSTAGKKKRIDRKTMGGLMNSRDIADALGLEQKHIYDIIKKNDLQPDDKQGNALLFNKSILGTIKKLRLKTQRAKWLRVKEPKEAKP